MANKYLDSAGGNTASYESTTDAATTLVGLLAGATVAAGETIWAKNDSITVESSSAAVTLASEGATPETPLKVICVSDWDSSPSQLSEGSKITTTGNYSITIQGYWLFSGVTFNPCYSGSPGSISQTLVAGTNAGPHSQSFYNCTFVGLNHASSRPIVLGYIAFTTSDPIACSFNNCVVKFGNAAAGIMINTGRHEFVDLSLDSGSTAPTNLFVATVTTFADVSVADSDLSNKAIGALVSVGSGFNGRVTFRNCKLHASTAITSGSIPAPGCEVVIIDCDSGDTYTRHARYGYEGIWSVATSIYATTTPADMSSGAGDTFSIQMVSSATVSKHLPLYSQWMQVWNDAAAYTPSIEVLVGADGADALNTDELWVEVDYNSGADSPLGTRTTTKPGLLTAGSAVDAGTTAWTGDGYTTERTHKLSTAQITPDKPGWIYMRVALAKASATIYVNPPL